jgi:hypothetical protein
VKGEVSKNNWEVYKMRNDIDIDKLKSIINLKKCLSKSEYQQVFNLLSDEEKEKLNYLEFGLKKEDELILISKLLGKCVSIQKIDQSKYDIKGNMIPPDLIATYKRYLDTPLNDKKNQISLFIEVKKCHKERWKISNKDFDQRVRFAKLNDKPLFFAINFTHMNLNLWTLFPSDYIKKNNFKIHIEQWGNSLFDYLLGNLTVFFKEFELTKIYSKSAQSISKHPKYGGTDKITISSENNQFEFSGNDPIILIFYGLTSISDYIEENEKTIRKWHYINQITTLYQILIGCIKVLYENNEDFDLGKYLKKIIEEGDSIINLDFGNYIINKMESIGIAKSFIWNPELT